MAPHMADVSGKIALITGGSSGIGLATARAMLAAGAAVAIASRDESRLQNAAAALAAGDRVFAHACDVTDKAQVRALVNAVVARFGRIDILVNNAGVNVKNRASKDLDPETWDKLIRANLDGTFYVTHAVLPQMRERRGGIIINIGSVVGKRANPLGGAGYNAAKFGMAALGLTLSVEEKDFNIRVTNIYPGEVDTPLLDHRPQPVTAEHRAKVLQPEDVAAAVMFVCTLPPRAHVPELVIKPTWQVFF
jgi:NADP-dependent 3-hydroxy acid dehydrogenase YdfG